VIPQGTLHGNKFFVVAGRRWLVAEAGGLTLGFALHLVAADLYEMKTVVGADVSLFRSTQQYKCCHVYVFLVPL